MPRSYIRAINGETMNLSAPYNIIPTGRLQISNEWLATKRTNVNFLLEIVLCNHSRKFSFAIILEKMAIYPFSFRLQWKDWML